MSTRSQANRWLLVKRFSLLLVAAFLVLVVLYPRIGLVFDDLTPPRLPALSAAARTEAARLEQNWPLELSQQFHVTSQGTRTIPIPLSWMEAIKNLIKQIVILFLPAEQKEVIPVLESYAAAFMTFKPSNVIGYFNQPLSLLLDTGPEVFNSEVKVTKYLELYMKELQDKHYAKDVLTKMRLKTITRNCVVTSFHLVRLDTSGQPFDNLNAMYSWRKTDGQWRVIIGVILSDDHLPAVAAS